MAGKGTGVGESQRRTGVWVAVGLLLLVFGFTVALTLPTYVDRSNPFWVVGMLVIFGAALSLVAVVFKWLGLASAEEAFGLPAGSVRTLLAIGIMVLFAVFGLQAVSVPAASQHGRLSEQPIGSAVAPAAPAALQAELKRLQDQGMAAMVRSIDGDRATLTLFRIDRERPATVVDMEKQVLTALITLLTSVVSFYFGSRSAEAARDAKGKGTDDGIGLATVEADLKKLDEALADQARRYAAVAGDTAASGGDAALAEVLGPLGTEAKAIAEARSRLEPLLTAARRAGEPSPDLLQAQTALQQRVAAFGARLEQAEALVAKG